MLIYSNSRYIIPQGHLEDLHSKAIDSKLPLRPPRALNCGMALKRQETDHNKRKTKVPRQELVEFTILLVEFTSQNWGIEARNVAAWRYRLIS